MFTYEKTNIYFAQTAEGFEDLVRAELEVLGAVDIKKSFRGLHFKADRKTLYRANYLSRFATRILAPLITFDCHSTKYLHKTAMQMDWERLLSMDTTFAISASCSGSSIKHSQYASLCLKDAIADFFIEKHDKRPDVKKHDPDVGIHLHIRNNKATISLDTSGGSLHRRGYRKGSVEAPMQETLAAAIIELSGWDGKKPLLDPMCGSGTLLAEALMKYCRVPAGLLRRNFGFERLPDFAVNLWNTVKQQADAEIRPLPGNLIYGSDVSKGSVAATKGNLSLIPSGSRIEIRKASFQDIESAENTCIICNPPYGIRMGEKEAAGLLMKDFGDFLKHRCRGSSACLYFGDRDLLKRIGLKPSWKKPLKSGGLDGVLAMYQMY